MKQHRQSRRRSLVEALVGTAIGFISSVLLSLIVYPLHGHAFTFAQNVSITLIFTIFSILRGYGVRRFFVWLDQP